MELNFQAFVGEGEPLIIMHGLFGSARNWQGIAKQLADRFSVYTLDLRNHGNSPHSDRMSYSDMATDVAQLMHQQGLAKAHILGHSMGGKVAMTLALTQPELIDKLIIVDIAPIAYQHGFEDILSGLKAIPLATLKSRQQADTVLADYVEASSLRQFLLQNLVPIKGGGYQWRIDIGSIEKNLNQIIGFEEISGAYLGDSLFIGGAASTYLSDTSQKEALRYFPNATIKMIPKVGHWPHIESPKVFLEYIGTFVLNTK